MSKECKHCHKKFEIHEGLFFEDNFYCRECIMDRIRRRDEENRLNHKEAILCQECEKSLNNHYIGLRLEVYQLGDSLCPQWKFVCSEECYLKACKKILTILQDDSHDLNYGQLQSLGLM